MGDAHTLEDCLFPPSELPSELPLRAFFGGGKVVASASDDVEAISFRETSLAEVGGGHSSKLCGAAAAGRAETRGVNS